VDVYLFLCALLAFLFIQHAGEQMLKRQFNP